MAEPELVAEDLSESDSDVGSQSESESEATVSFLDSPTFKESSIRVLEALPTDTERLQLSKFLLKYDKLLTTYKEATAKCHNVLINRVRYILGKTTTETTPGFTTEELTSIYHSAINSKLGQKLRQKITV